MFVDVLGEIDRLAVAPDIFQARIDRLRPHIHHAVERLADRAELLAVLQRATFALSRAGGEAMASVLDRLLNDLYALEDDLAPDEGAPVPAREAERWSVRVL